MDPRRRVLGVAIAVVVLAGLPIARPAAQTQCDHGDENAPGPICATLSPPNTFYEVLDPGNGSIRVDWRATNLSCGNFYPGTEGFDAEGEPIDDETGLHATWSHANGAPDNCSHNAPDHPGTIVADVEVGYRFSNLEKIDIPGFRFRCSYSGSSGGTGPSCVPAPSDPECRVNDGDVSVTIGGADVKIAGEEGNLIVDFPGDEAPDCAVPLNEAASVWLWGGDEIDEVTVETPGLMDVAGDFVPDAINGGPGIDVVAYSQYVNPVVVNVASPPIDEIPGELKGVVVLDVDDDGEHEVGMALPGSLELGLSPGDDKFSMTRQAVSLLEDQTTGPVLKVDGGAGTDAATIETLPSRPTFLGQDLEIMRTLGQSLVYGALVNFDGKSDETVDAAWAGFERFTMMGSSKNDTVLGTGGAGTGGSFAYPLTIIGKGGKDRLTGGAANDKLNGGPDRDVCNGGKGRDIASKCETTKNVP